MSLSFTNINVYRGVYHHFNGFLGAANCDQPGKAITAELVGAKYEHEVSLQNGLSVNIHLLMLAFYRFIAF